MLTNYHTHTTRCGHAEGTEEEYILTALRCGYKVLGFSDHTPWAYATPGFGGSTSTAHGRRYAEQVVEALETGLYRYLAHPDLFLNRVTAFDADAEKACRDICAAAARLDIPLEYNMAGLTLQDRPDGSLGYTRDEFWRIAAEYPVKAIVGCDAHAPSELDVVPAIEEKKAFLHSLGIPVLDTLPGLE